jgi:hypothetical protein
VPAEPGDIQIVCGQYNIDAIPEAFTPEEEKVLKVIKITNHPWYTPGTNEDVGANVKGPYAGNDISVYHVDDAGVYLNKETMWPACLPRAEEAVQSRTTQTKDFFSGWMDPEPYYRISNKNKVGVYRKTYLFPRKSQAARVDCKDPDWMRSTSFYPAATLCYKDPAEASCFQFGNSGSSVMTHFKDGEKDRYAFTGPLSMHKGCDEVNNNFVGDICV